MTSSEQAALLRDLTANVPGGIFRYILRPDGTDSVDYISDHCLRIWEIPAHTVLQDATPLWAMIHPDDLEGMGASVMASGEALTPWRHAWRFRPPSGVTRWVQGYGTPMRLPDGSTRWHSLILDVTAEREAQARLLTTLRQTVGALGAVIEARDPYTAGHQARVMGIARLLGEALGLDEHRLEGLALSASVHDIGKIRVPIEILSKPTRLTDAEWALIRSHAAAGADLIAHVDFPWPIAAIIAQHHERCDGSGYPRGLKGDEILFEARILAVADTLEAMATDRPYRAAMGLDAAMAELRGGAGTRYEPEVVAACERLVAQGALKDLLSGAVRPA